MSWLAALLGCLILLSPMGAHAASANFHLFDQEGQMVSLEDQAGRPIVLFFWASWSHPGEDELRALQEIVHDKQVSIIAVDEAVEESRPTDVQARIRDLHLDMPVLFDEIGEAAHALHISDLPALVVLDGERQVIWRKDGKVGASDFRAALEKAREAPHHIGKEGTRISSGKLRDIMELGGRFGTPRRGASIPRTVSI